MDLAAALNRTTDGPGNTCHVSLLRHRLSAEDLATLDAALADPMMQTSRIHTALLALGHDVGAHSLQRHRRGGCKCER